MPESFAKHRARKADIGPPPDRLSLDQLDRLLALCGKRGLTYAEARWLWIRVRGWWEARRQPRADWVMVAVNAVDAGWGLRGFKRWRDARRLPAWHDEKLTAENRERALAEVRSRR